MSLGVSRTHADEACAKFWIGVRGKLAVEIRAEPTGHVLSSIANGELEFTSVNRSGMCAKSNMFFAVFFLIEDCENEIEATEFQTSHKTFTSEIWNCENSNSNSNVSAYREWIKL